MKYGAFKLVVPDNFMEIIAGKEVQLISPKRVLGEKHLVYCIESTIKAFRQGKSICNSRQLELMLRLSGQRQIKNALDMLGVTPGDKECIIVGFDDDDFNAAVKKLNARKTRLRGAPLVQQLDAIEGCALLSV